MRLLVSPWVESFDSLARSINHSALLVSPFISEEPLQRLSSILDKHAAVTIQILTSLDVDNLIQGTTDADALASFCRIIPSTTVRHLPRLHAKVYVADDRLAILTSANLTGAGLNKNYEYGIEITDPILVSKISEDLKAYRDLGAEVSLLDLDQLAEISHELQERQTQILKSARQTLRQEFKRKVEAATEALMYLRAKPGETTNKLTFTDACGFWSINPRSSGEQYKAARRDLIEAISTVRRYLDEGNGEITLGSRVNVSLKDVNNLETLEKELGTKFKDRLNLISRRSVKWGKVK